MSHVGEKLKAKREELGISIAEIAESTKINPRVIKAIEENDERSLPAKSYVKGFVRTYARFVKLDAEALVDEYKNPVPEFVPPVDEGTKDATPEEPKKKADPVVESKPLPTPPIPTHPVTKAESEGIKPIGTAKLSSKTAAKYVAGLVVAILVVAGINTCNKYEKERQVADLPPALSDIKVGEEKPRPSEKLSPEPNEKEVAQKQDSAKPETAPEQKSNAEVVAEPELKPAPEPEKPELEKKAAEEKPVEETKTVETPAAVEAEVKPEPKIEPAAEPKPTPVATPEPKKESPAPEPKVEKEEREDNPPPAATAKSKELIIEALDNVSVTLNVDGSEAKTLQIKADEKNVIRYKRRLSISVSDGGAVIIVVNGVDKGVPGTLGRPITLSYQ